MARPLQLGGPTGSDWEARWRWIESALRAIERASHVDSAENIVFQPTTSIAADTVQSAIEEVDGDVSLIQTSIASIQSALDTAEARILRAGLEGRQLITTEALSAGDLVNVFSTGGPRLRLADAGLGVFAHGFVLTAFSSGSTATFYLSGINDLVSGLTPGAGVFLSTNAGDVTGSIPTTDALRQLVGFALSSSEFYFGPLAPHDPNTVSS